MIPVRLFYPFASVILLWALAVPLKADTDLMRRHLPNALDVMEYGLNWLQEYTGPENSHDPAAVVLAMEDQLARYFDLGQIAQAVAGAEYWQQDILARSHFQNRVRDRLFTELARIYGFYGFRPPQIRMLMPVRTGVNAWITGNQIWHPDGRSYTILFHLYWTARGMRVMDVSVNGQSITRYLRELYQQQRW